MKSIYAKLLVVLFFSCTQVTVISQTNHVVISQLFGSGGTSTALPNNDFIELYNPTASLVNVNGWSVQFAFGAATTYTKISLAGVILPYGYYLIQLSRDNIATGRIMPTPDVIFNYNINLPDMKVGLRNNNNALSGANPSASCIDFVGTGAANGYEGGTAAQGSYLVSLLRKSSTTSTAVSMSSTGAEFAKGNGWDSNNNASDLLLTTFVVARNSNISPLAVHLLSFNLTKSGSTNLLRWQVEAADEMARFEVEKSSDGLSFSRIGQLNKTTATDYQFTDGNSIIAAYYRIRIVGGDGKTQNSPVVFAEGKQTATMKIYPTLATEWVMIQLPQNTTGGEVMIYGMDGRLQQRLLPAANEVQIKLPLSTLKPGTYVVQYITVYGQKTMERFVKAG